VSKKPSKQQTRFSVQGKTKIEMRQQRLATALRENLKRRKVQQGGRLLLSESDNLTVPDGLEELD
jgi:hypothetical protein